MDNSWKQRVATISKLLQYLMLDGGWPRKSMDKTAKPNRPLRAVLGDSQIQLRGKVCYVREKNCFFNWHQHPTLVSNLELPTLCNRTSKDSFHTVVFSSFGRRTSKMTFWSTRSNLILVSFTSDPENIVQGKLGRKSYITARIPAGFQLRAAEMSTQLGPGRYKTINGIEQSLKVPGGFSPFLKLQSIQLKKLSCSTLKKLWPRLAS